MLLQSISYIFTFSNISYVKPHTVIDNKYIAAFYFIILKLIRKNDLKKTI